MTTWSATSASAFATAILPATWFTTCTCRFSTNHPASAFLRKVTFNRAIDRVRAESLRADYLAAANHDEPALDSWDGARELDFEQQLHALLAIIEALPARQRQVFLLHRIHGMAQRDIAAELEISVNMVTQHFNRALRTIASRWEPARRLQGEARA